ncbi:hypothetical protein [Macellibacteroides fermentans]|uniref:hypothetical protein n=1 Tax=Macellibacteroides fermentans TaxID=879969 RepID=UPI00406CD653
MRKISINNIVTSRDKANCVISEKGMQNRVVYKSFDIPIYKKFNIETPILSGVGSVVNVPGNYYSFHKFFSAKKDKLAIESDWKKVGVAIFEALEQLDIK